MKVRLPKSMSPGMGMNMNNVNQLMRQAQKAQENLENASKELDMKTYSASSGGEQVKVTVLGTMEIQNLSINPEIVDPDDTEMLSDMIKAAVNEALKKAKSDRDATMESISSQVPTEFFERLPGIGKKTAQKLAFSVLKMPKESAQEFAKSIIEAHEKVHYCSLCYSFTDKEICDICTDNSRDKSIICVVEDTRDVEAI